MAPASSAGASWFALEPRIMFDGAAAATVDGIATAQSAQSHTETSFPTDDVTAADTVPSAAPTGEPQFTSGDQALFDALATYDASHARQEIVFLSPTVREYQKLLDGLSPDVEVHVLDPTRDGVAQMAEVLAGRTGVDAVHLITEGNEAQLHLGTSFLTQDSINTQYAQGFQEIGQALSADADVLIYGCNFGRGEAGAEVIRTLAMLTGADVAASTDLTGHMSQTGDWILESTTGTIESTIVISTSTQAAWDHTMLTYTVSNLNDSGVGSLRDAIAQSNASTTVDDTIVFSVSGTITLLSGLTISDTVSIDASSSGLPSIVLDGNDLAADGLVLASGSGNSTIRGFVVRDFGDDGIEIQAGSDGNTIAGNYIGRLNTSGTDAGAGEANSNSGLRIQSANNTIGGSTAADRNVISGNSTIGIVVTGASAVGNQISGNYIGLNAGGSTTLGNGDDGIQLIDGSSGTIVGGNSTAYRNVIAANGDGIQVGLNTGSNNNVIRHNYVGTDSTGLLARGNSDDGIDVWRNSAGNQILNNVVAANSANGLFIGNNIGDASGTVIQGNWVGVGADGITALGNLGDGIDLGSGALANNVRVGGTGVGEGNIVANNSQDGIWIASSTGISILGNSIYNNGETGIDLAPGGVTTNDAGDVDTGANNLQNFPVLSGAVRSNASSTTITGTLNSTANSYFRIEFFSNVSVDSTNYGEGQTYLGYANVATNGSGNATFNAVLSVDVQPGRYISATATKSDSAYTTFTDTSEFAQSIVVNAAPVNTVPGAQSTNEDTNLVFSSGGGNQISITDPDSTGASFEVTLTVTSGTATLSGTTGLTFTSGDGTADSTMTLRGTVANINTALNGLTYSPTSNFNGGTTLTIATRDSTLVSLDIDANLQARYTFQGNANDVAPGTAQDGTLTNEASIVTDGTRGQVLSLDGVDDYVQITGLFGNPTDITLAAWVNLTAPDTNGATVISLGDSVSFRVDDASQYLVGFVYDGSGWQEVRTSAVIAGTGWRHVAFSFSDSGNLGTVYLDGTAIGTATITASINYTLNPNSFIGKHGNGNTTFDFNGTIDDARVYNRALSAAEVATLAKDLSLTDTDSVAVTVNAVNDSPTVGGGSIPAIAEDTTNPPGQTISSMIGGTFSDPDTGASLAGVLITNNPLNAAQGIWQYSTDSGTSWHDVGAIAYPNALVLSAGTSLRFLPAPDYNGSPDILSFRGLDNTYAGGFTSGATKVTSDASSPGGSSSISSSLVSFSTVISAVNDAPVLTSNGGGATASVSVIENTTAVTTVTSTDVDGSTPVYSIVPVSSGGAADAARFTINSSTGVLSFVAAPDFENPTDAGGNNVYDVTAQTSDGNGGTDTQAIAVTVTNQAITTVGASGSATAVAGGTYTLNLAADEDATSWTINWGDGAIETVAGDPSSVTHVYVIGNAGLTFNILVSAADAAGTHFPNDLIVPTAFLTGEGLYRYLGTTGTFSQYFSGTELTNPYATVIGPDGLLYVAGHTSDNIVRYNAVTGAYVDTFVTTGSGGLNAAAGLVFGADGHLYVSDQIGDRILKYNGTTGAFLSAFVSAGSGGLNAPTALSFRADGYLYVASYNSNSILRYNASTGAFVGTFVTSGSGGLSGPGGMTWGNDGHLYVTNNTDTVKRYNGSTGAFIDNFVTTGSGGLDEAIGLAFGPDGHLYVSSYLTDKVIRYNGTTGTLIGDYVTAASGGLDGPAAFAFRPSHQVALINSNPVITSNGGGATASISVGENATAVTDVDAIDSEAPPQTLTYSLSGTDAGDFTINTSTGVLTFTTAPDFEAPTDADLNNIYQVTVQVADGFGGVDAQNLTITVTDVNDEPTLTATGTNPTFTEDGSAVDLFSSVTASTVEAGQTLTRLDFTVSNVSDGAAERIAVDGTTIQLVNGGSGTTTTNGMSYSVTVVSGIATVSLTKAAGLTPAQMQTLVDGMTYQNTSQDPTTANRVVTLTRLDDNGATGAPNDNTATLSLTSTVTVNAVNDAPVLSVSGSTIVVVGNTYTLNLSATDVDGVTISSWTINWGDGSIDTIAGNPSSATHIYTATQVGLTESITVSVTDADGTHFDNDLLVPSWTGTDVVYRYDGSAGTLLGSFAGSQDDQVEVVTGPDGNLYVTALGSGNVVKYAADGTLIGTFVANGSGGLSGAAGLAFGPDGHLYVSDYNTGNVLRFNGTTGAFIDVFVNAVTYGMSSTLGMTFGPDGQLYVANRGTNSVLRFDATTGTRDLSFSFTSAAPNLEDIVFGPDGELYVVDYSLGVLRYSATDGTFLGTFVAIGSGGLSNPTGLTFGPDGHLYVSDQLGSGAVRRYDGTTGTFLDNYASGGGLDNPTYLNFAPSHQALVTSNQLVVDTVVDNNDSGIAAGNATHTISWLLTNKGADGLISLREAILAANNTTGADTIQFNISGAGPHTINLLSALPSIDEIIMIDGTSEPDFVGTPMIEINGASAGAGATGLYLNTGSDNSVIRGLVINRFGGTGIVVGADNVTIAGNYIGTDVTGTVDLGNGVDGILLGSNANNAIIGGATAAARNIVSGNTARGIAVSGSGTGGGHLIQGNYIGTNAPGTADLGNGGHGVDINNSAGNTIRENLVSGNDTTGVILYDEASDSNVVVGNYIGTNAAGTAAIGNGTDGIVISGGADNNLIGGTTATDRNVISGNVDDGIYIGSTGTTDNIVSGNYIGTNAAGTAALGNGRFGVVLYDGVSNTTIGGAVAGAGNLISGNVNAGIQIDANNNAATIGNVIKGNRIGLNVTGNAALGNGSDGIRLIVGVAGTTIGGANADERNIIAGNVGDGIEISDSSNNTVMGNRIGTDVTGTSDLGNSNNGVSIIGNSTGNVIGTNLDSTNDLLEGNLISGNNNNGIQFWGGAVIGNFVRGNLIGVNSNATATLGNGTQGIQIGGGADTNTVGGTSTAAANVVAGNTNAGIELLSAGTTGNIVEGNFVGTNSGGVLNLANGSFGVIVFNGATGNTIGGTAPGTGNTVTFNNNDGIRVQDTTTTGNALLGNRIYSNVGLGINLGSDAVTPNDPGDGDTDANNLTNFPIIYDVVVSGGFVTVTGEARPGTTVEFFEAALDSSGYGEGQTFLYRDTVAGGTAGLVDATARQFSFTFAAGSIVAGDRVTMTATDSSSNTSEFSASILAFATASTSLIVDTASDIADGDTTNISALLSNRGADGFISLREAILATNNTAGLNTINFNIAGAGVHTINPGSFLPIITDAVVIDGYSQSGASANTLAAGNDAVLLIELNGTGVSGSHGVELGVGSDGSTIRGLVINRWSNSGIFMSSNNNIIEGNVIGADAGGNNDLGNTASGIHITGANNMIGGTTAAARNLISGNNQYGVRVDGVGASSNVIAGNYIGTDTSGTLIISNSLDGVYLTNGASSNTVGGATTAHRNVITGNADDGVQIGGASNNVIRNNYIGTNVTGLSPLGNADDGIDIDNGSANNQILDNLISDNVDDGIDLGDVGANPGTIIRGNMIGLRSNGTSALGNGGHGIRIGNGGTADNTIIGGTIAGQGNTIAYNDGNGISIVASTGVSILGNAIYSNVGLGIDLGVTGVTPNDGVLTGGVANQHMDFPVLTTVSLSGSNLTVAGYIGTNPLGDTDFAGARVEIFLHDGSGDTHGEGRTILGFLTADANGLFSGILTLSTTVTATDRITATATSTTNDSSEFSLNTDVNVAPVNTVPGAQTVNEDSSLPFTGPNTISVNDADGNLNTVQLEVLNGTVTVTLQGGATISAGGNSTNTLTLGGSQADINATLATLTYQGTLNYTGAETLTVTSTDSNGVTDVDTVAITVTSVNDAPTSSGGNVIGVENTPYVFGWSNFTISDVDTAIGNPTAIQIVALPADGVLEVSNGFSWERVTVNQTVTKATIDSGWLRFTPDTNESGYDGNSSPGVGNGLQDYAQFTFKPMQTIAIVNPDAEFGVTYPENTGNNVATGWTITGTGTVYTGNYDATIFLTDHDQVFNLYGGAQISQVLGGNLSTALQYSLSVDVGWATTWPSPQFSVELWAGGTQLGTVDHTSVTPVIGDFVRATLTVDGSLFGAANGQPLEIRLRESSGTAQAVFFDNVLLTAAPGGVGAVATMTIDITPVNDVPVITPVGPNVTFIEGGAPQVIDTLITVSDVDSPNFDTGVLTVSLTQNGTVDDRLLIRNVGTGPGQVGASGVAVTYGGVTIGTFSGGTSGSDPLIVTFNSSATVTAVQAVLASIQFNNVSDTPSTLDREVTYGVTDGDGGTAIPVTKTVLVQATNDVPTGAPVVTGVVTEDQTLTADTSTIADADGLGAFSYQWQRNGVDIGGATSSTYLLGDGDVGANIRVRVSYTDGQGTAESLTSVAVGPVANINDPPVIATNTGSTVVRGGTDSITTAELQVTDVDNAPGQLTYTVTVGPANGRLELTTAAGVAITAFTQSQIDAGQVVYIHDGSFTASDSVTFTVSDGAGGTIGATTFGMTVTLANSVPALAVNAGSTVIQGLTDTITAGELRVTDLDNTPDQLQYTVTTGPLNGRLELTTAPGIPITRFTQADLDAGRVMFVHDGAVSTSDSFVFTVDDGAGGTMGATTFPFVVSPFAPPPGGGGGGASSGGGGSTGGSGGTGSGSGSGSSSGTGSGSPVGPAPGSGPASGSSGEAVPPSIVASTAPSIGVVGRDVVVERATANDSLPRVTMMNQLLPRIEPLTPGTQEPGELFLPESIGRPVKQALIVGHQLAERLTRLAEELERGVQEREAQSHLVGRVASFSGMALSAGFVAWILRGGSLVASFLVSMPAWRHFDPLPVLGMPDHDRRKRDRKMREEDEQEKQQFSGLDRVLKSSHNGPDSKKRDS